MSADTFKAPHRWGGAVFHLAAQKDAPTLLPEFNKPMTAYIRAVGYALLVLTNEQNPNDWQEAKPADVLKLIHGDDAPTAFTGSAYGDVLAALYALRHQDLPLAMVTVVRQGRAWKKQFRIRRVAMIQGFGMVYVNNKTGEKIHPQEDDRFDRIREAMEIRGFDRHANETAAKTATGDTAASTIAGRKKRRARDIAPQDDKVVYQLPDNPAWTLTGFEWRWGTDLVEDLLMEPAKDSKGQVKRDHRRRIIYQGTGFIPVKKAIFQIERSLRKQNLKYAERLLQLVIFDRMGKGPTRQKLECPAKTIFAEISLPEPGDIRRGHLHDQDGQWSYNVATVAEAVRALKAEDVLLPESDEEPYVDPNPERRKAPYYRWKRSPKWTFPSFVEIVAEAPVPSIAASTGSELSASEPTAEQMSLPCVTDPPRPEVHGRDIKAAREAAGMTLRDFAKRFGMSIKFWSDIENELLSRRTGKPKQIPPTIRDQVEAFVAESGRKEGQME